MVERKISVEDAQKYHGITAQHGIMHTNGELRFRLNCSVDGTAYIRTETKGETSGWQTAHYHRGVFETYIVQKGGVILAKFKGQDIVFDEYNPGEIFTTEKNVPHNICMLKNTVIHTIKHGEAVSNPHTGSDWWNDTDDCKKLNEISREHKND